MGIYRRHQIPSGISLSSHGGYYPSYNYEFVLANNIDLSGIKWTPIGNNSHNFKGSFNGNGHTILNLTIDNPSDDNQGLFGVTDGYDEAQLISIKNLTLKNCSIKGRNHVGAIAGYANGTIIENCQVTGTISGQHYVGGILGCNSMTSIENCTVKADVTGNDYVGGISGSVDSYIGGLGGSTFDGNVTGNNYVGGLTGNGSAYGTSSGNITGNNYVGGISGRTTTLVAKASTSANVTGNEYVGGIVGYMGNSPADSTCDFLLTSIGTVTGNAHVGAFIGVLEGEGEDDIGDFCVTTFSFDGCKTTNTIPAVASYASYLTGIVEGYDTSIFNEGVIIVTLPKNNYVTLQVGINADSYSQIGLEFGFALDGIEGLRQIGLDTSTDYLSTLDNMLDIVSAKATEYGAAQNRLESALDEIAIQYDNLVSSRSTLRDADIAEVSSLYIQQQILQQASATLLATANQSPSIALQLI